MKRVIKKYPNRRLYDTEQSRYITLADVRDLVIGGTVVHVVDQASGADITRSILFQVIAEQEQHGESLMSEAFLAQVVRAHEHVAAGFLGRHLEKSLTTWLAQQNELLGEVRQAVGGPEAIENATNRQKVG